MVVCARNCVLRQVRTSAVGSSMSISSKSWLNLFVVVPVSVVVKNVIGALLGGH